MTESARFLSSSDSEIGVWERGSVGVVESFGEPAGHDSADAKVFTGSSMMDPAESIVSEGVERIGGLDGCGGCSGEDGCDVDAGFVN